MRRHKNDELSWDVSERIKSLEMFTGSLVGRPQAASEAIPIIPAEPTRVPEPRRSRIFLRNGGSQGVFAELTVTAPQPRPALD